MTNIFAMHTPNASYSITQGSRLLLTGRLLFCGAVVAYLGLLIIVSKYGLPLKKGVATTGYVILRLTANGGNTIFQLKPWQADLFHFFGISGRLVLFGMCWHLVLRSEDSSLKDRLMSLNRYECPAFGAKLTLGRLGWNGCF